MEEKKLLLFDIDGTILTTFGQAKNAFSFALKEIFGTDGRINSFSWSGKLDPNIVLELMLDAGFEKDYILKNLQNVLSLYEKTLEKNIIPEKTILKDGIKEILEETSKEKNIFLGLCTGNTPEGARIKLSSVNLYHYFKIGAYGTDGQKREELPPIAKIRAETFFKVKIEKENVFVIGDAPADIESAKANGFNSIGVYSGFHKREELLLYDPDLLIESFKVNKDDFWKFVRNGKP